MGDAFAAPCFLTGDGDKFYAAAETLAKLVLLLLELLNLN